MPTIYFPRVTTKARCHIVNIGFHALRPANFLVDASQSNLIKKSSMPPILKRRRHAAPQPGHADARTLVRISRHHLVVSFMVVTMNTRSGILPAHAASNMPDTLTPPASHRPPSLWRCSNSKSLRKMPHYIEARQRDIMSLQSQADRCYHAHFCRHHATPS